MSAEVASYPASVPATPPPTPADFKYEEPKVYISTAKLELKLSAVQLHTTRSGADYVWHTQVVPPAAETEQVELSETLVQASVASQPVEAVNRNLFTPTQRHGEKPGSLAATLYDFMDVERYHSERNQLANKGQINNEKESTYV